MPDYYKKIYHDEVFRFCYEHLEFFESDKVSFLKRMLKDAEGLCKDLEKDFLLSIGNDNEERIINITNKIVKRLLNYFSSFYKADYSGFDSTFEYLTKIIDLYDFEAYIINEAFVNFVDRFFPVAAPEERLKRRLTRNNCFRIFYAIIKNLIKDINNQEEAWKIVGDYYKNKYILKTTDDNIVFTNELSDNTPISFLSYTFLDTAYGFYLFLLFLDNGGFIYFDAILGKPLSNGTNIKKALNIWIKRSSQFLFLRSVNSDNGGIRQWCSWEIGSAFNYCHQFYYVDVVAAGKFHNKLLDDFNQFNGVFNGIIY